MVKLHQLNGALNIPWGVFRGSVSDSVTLTGSCRDNKFGSAMYVKQSRTGSFMTIELDRKRPSHEYVHPAF